MFEEMDDTDDVPKLPNRLHKPRPSETTNNRQYQIAPLRAMRAPRDGEQARQNTLVKTTSPWTIYRKIFKLQLGDNDPLLVAERRGEPFDLVSIYPRRGLSEDQLKMLAAIQNPKFVMVHDVYKEDDEYHIIREHMPRSLQEVVGNPYIDRPQLAAIVGQVVTALAYLERQGLQHGHLTCSQILLHQSGRVKLCGQEDCSASAPDSKKDIRDLAYVMMELMEGYVKKGHNVGLDEPSRWHPEVVSFLSATTSALSADELLQHPFLCGWQRSRLQGLVSLVMTWTMQDYKYLAEEEND